MRKSTVYSWINKKKYILKINVISIINYIWFKKTIMRFFLYPFSLIYFLVIKIIYILYKCNFKKTYNFNIPIIVIGNITVGGNGKTPLVIWLSKQLKKRKWKVGVVSRGYGRKYDFPIIINSNFTHDICGDEPILIHKRSNVPVAVSSNRILAIKMLLEYYNLDIIISDDGLQHHSMGRCIEWIVIDNNRKFGNNLLLPAGPMRETKKKLNKVNKVIINGCCRNKNIIKMNLYHKNYVINLLNGSKKRLNDLFPTILISGISNNKNFFSMVRKSGIIPIREISFPDHYIYDKNILTSLTKNNEHLLMTEKDSIKCKYFAKINWWYLPIYVFFSKKCKEVLLSSVEKKIIIFKFKNKKNNIFNKI
ncbi:ycaH [Wigglesworthia glossinidia endosymbiont of Glossina brevipalpis]|uniref:Tetraacyldisaccharide 4'-kinase n=1 Tax=Wigglesworthia glossinidia brevipalpis TaxID=36870 RepID=LPXK_WIGBR|nr:RecName: Full=Tetraacyldisaccharide 4'-kinase; AltName: Full=Lipid A 4'-kinase [Wigglesworthia glossinidia endosymbiont of Glossina brevipalpis]BAC24399.1 ycaH [Wigglesworthia glossinidia endosymbiont of Glossina brevipalpis]